MPIKSRIYHKANKSRRTRKNKTTRRYKKKQMRGGEVEHIKNEVDLKKSWDNGTNMWMANNGLGKHENFFRVDYTTYEDFEKVLEPFLKIVKKVKNFETSEAYILAF